MSGACFGVLAVALAALAIPGAAFAEEPIEPTTTEDGGDGAVTTAAARCATR